MRTALELIVRPFVAPQITSPKQPAPGTVAPSTTASNTVIDIGSDQVTTWSGNYDQMVSFYFIKKPKEKKKDSTGSDPFAPDPAFPTGFV